MESSANMRSPQYDEEYNGQRVSTTNTAKFRSGAQDVPNAFELDPFSNPGSLQAKD